MKKKLNLKLKAITNESLYDDLEKVRLKHASNKDLSTEEIEADLKDRFKRAVEAYKKYASVQSKDDLLEENLFENTINRVSRDFAIGTDKIRELLREEATKMDDANTTPEKAIADKIEKSNLEITPNQAEKSAEAVKELAQKTDGELDVIYVEGDIEKALNASLSVGMRSYNKWLKRKEIDKNGYSNICIVGDVGVGKAQPLTSKVYTPTGYKLMGDIQVGDVVLDGKGNITEILDIFPQGERDIYRINFDDGTFIEVSDNHLNSVWEWWPKSSYKKQDREDSVLTTLELKKRVEASHYGISGNNNALFVDIPQIKSFSSAELPIDPYLLGCLLGDGSLRKTPGFTTADEELYNSIQEILDRDFKLSLRRNSKNDRYTYYIADADYKTNKEKHKKRISNVSKLKEIIAALNLNVTSEKKFIPEIYKYASFDDRLALIQGLMDTDGTVSKKVISSFSNIEVSGKINFNSTSEQLVDDVAFVLRSLGCKVIKKSGPETPFYNYAYKGRKEVRPCKQSFDLYIVPNSNIKLFRLSRKLERLAPLRFEPRRKIMSVVFDRVDKCQCIYVASEEHTYLTDNLTVTHNTERVKAWCNAHKIRMVSFKADSLTIDDIKAIPIGEDPDNPGRAKTVSFGTFDIFDKEDLCVLYLDEYNRATTSKRNAWFKFMDEHAIYDPMNKETGMKFFPNLLFTIVTINPYIYEDGLTDDEEGVSPLSKAEKNRFAAYMHLSSQGADFNKYTAEYFKKYYKRASQLDPEDAAENAGRLSIALKLLENPNFFFNDTAKINSLHSIDSQFLTPRSLTLLLTRCDGTVENFLALAPYAVGEENTKMLKTLLKNYTNIADKPNEVWSFWDNFGLKLPKEEAEEAEEAEQGILQKKSNMLDKLNDLRNRHI